MNGGSLTVLVIEDEPQIRRLVRNALTAEAARLAPDGGGTGRRGKRPRRRGRNRPARASTSPLENRRPSSFWILVCPICRASRSVAKFGRGRRCRSSCYPRVIRTPRRRAFSTPARMTTSPSPSVPSNSSPGFAHSSGGHAARRASADAPSLLSSFGDIVVDQQRRRVERNGEPIHLTPTEWALLRTFISHPRQTLTHQQLFQAVWGNAAGDAQQYLRVYVGHLRRKIETDPVRPRFLLTEAGVGYRFEPDGATA